MTENQEVQDQMRRLQVARAKCEELVKEQNRLTGEQGALQAQMTELETKSQSDFGCPLSGLPDLLARLKESSATALENAEIILGMREGKIAVAPTPVAAPAAPKLKPARGPAPASDEDGLP